MAPAISKFPSFQFYDGKLKNAQAIYRRPLPSCLQAFRTYNYFFFDLLDSVQQEKDTSYINNAELCTYTATDAVIVDWEHGLQPEADGPGKDDPLGRVLWSTVKADDTGLWVERVLNRRNRYVKLLEELIEAGLIGTSSEAVPDNVQKSAQGEIIVWPLRRDTLTVNPMDRANM